MLWQHDPSTRHSYTGWTVERWYRFGRRVLVTLTGHGVNSGCRSVRLVHVSRDIGRDTDIPAWALVQVAERLQDARYFRRHATKLQRRGYSPGYVRDARFSSRNYLGYDNSPAKISACLAACEATLDAEDGKSRRNQNAS